MAEQTINKTTYHKNAYDKFRKANSNKFRCESCNYSTFAKSLMLAHESSKKHKKNTNKNYKEDIIIEQNYSCDLCGYKTSIKCNYNKHIKSTKHKNKSNKNIKDITVIEAKILSSKDNLTEIEKNQLTKFINDTKELIKSIPSHLNQ